VLAGLTSSCTAASSALIVAMLSVFEVLADQKSGEFRSPVPVGLIFAAFVVVIVMVFYAEFRFRKKRPSSPFRTERRIFM
jgi:hypothetical protein